MRPKYRSQCRNGPRPCPWVGCRYHLYLEVTDAGTIRWTHIEEDSLHRRAIPIEDILRLVDKTFDDGYPTCSLDLAEQGGMTLEDVGGTMHLTRERIRQIEAKALIKLKAKAVKALMPYVTGEEDK